MTTPLDDFKELDRYYTGQRQRNYRQIPAKWDRLISNILSRLKTNQNGVTSDAPFLLCKNSQNGDTLLHLMCVGYPSASAIDSVLKYYSGQNSANNNAKGCNNITAVSQPNFRGATPLHVAIFCGASVEVVRLLINYQKTYSPNSPLSSMVMPGGTFPIHAACRLSSSEIAILKVLAEDDPSVLLKRRKNGTGYVNNDPLYLMWISYCDELGLSKGAANIKIMRNEPVESGEDILQHKSHSNARAKILAKTRILLLDPSFVNIKDKNLAAEPDFRLLHSLARVRKCPPGLAYIALMIETGEQLKAPDENGKIPLHYAASCEPCDIWVQPNCHDFVFQQSLIQVLVKADPITCRVHDARSGRLPLHFAAASGMDWEKAMRPIIDAYPDALDVIDPKTGLYPFMLAAAEKRESASKESTHIDWVSFSEENKEEGCDLKLTTIYKMIQACPDVLNGSHLVQFNKCEPLDEIIS